MANKPAAVWAVLALAGVLPTLAQAEGKPLSVIGWLSQSVALSERKAASDPARSQANLPAVRGEAPVSSGAVPAVVATTVLGKLLLDAVGLLPPTVTGFPANLWGIGKSAEIASQISQIGEDSLPALRSLLVTLLLAEAQAPIDSTGGGGLLLARIDKLLAMGALDQAQALIDAAGADANAELFRRSFDVSLLTGDENQACTLLKSAASLSPTLTTRVFCLARQGDWTAAALTLRTAQALGKISPGEDSLLTRFLDPSQFDSDEIPPAPKPVTPLVWKIYDALGQTIPTSTLPTAFARADLSDHAGWKAQIEAAERLARVGAITPNVLLGLYTDRAPAASGGVWDRADAFQRLDAALTRGDLTAVEQRLPLAYARMKDVELEVPFAMLFAGRLARLTLTGDAARISYELGLLSNEYERLAKANPNLTDARDRFLAGLAAGSVQGLTAPDSMARAIAPAFTAPTLPEDIAELVAQKRIGEAIVQAILRVGTGLQGDLSKVSEGIATLRVLGLEDVARRTALQVMLLERRG